MKKLFLLLALAFVAIGCHDHYQRPAVKGEEGAEGLLNRYGNSNCYLAYDKTSVTIDVKAYRVNEMNHTTFSLDENTDAVVPSSAELLWREESITLGTPVLDKASRTVTVDGIAGYGNAVVAIYDEEGTILWSYHIWKPLEDPTKTLGYIALGGCELMPMALGAVETGHINDRDRLENLANTAGLYYTNGRKDPMGRADFSETTKPTTFVKTLKADGSELDWKKEIVSADNALTRIKSDYIASYQGDKTYREIVDEAIKVVDVNSKEIIINYTIEHPTELVTPAVGSSYWYATDSIYRDKTLWYQVKTCYDPCPDGYMTVPATLFRTFLSSAITVVGGTDEGQETSDNVYSAGPDGINADNAYNMNKYYGYNFRYYGSLDPTKLDYYPASGYRASSSGALTNAGVLAMYGSYTLSFNKTTAYQRVLYFGQDTIRAHAGYAINALATTLRCMKISVFEDESE